MGPRWSVDRVRLLVSLRHDGRYFPRETYAGLSWDFDLRLLPQLASVTVADYSAL